MPAVLGKVTAAADAPRGPDAKLRIRVPHEWFHSGATIEIRLPRNLVCAQCDGGGCDACGGSGALTLRGRRDEPESLQVTLPEGAPASGGRGVTLRIPESGGHADADSQLPRGLLLLSVLPAEEPDANVRRWGPQGAAEEEEPEAASAVGLEPARWGLPALAAVLLLVLLAFVVARMSGCG